MGIIADQARYYSRSRFLRTSLSFTEFRCSTGTTTGTESAYPESSRAKGWAAVSSFADITNGLMAIPNLVCLLAMTGVVVAETRAHLWDTYSRV